MTRFKKLSIYPEHTEVSTSGSAIPLLIIDEAFWIKELREEFKKEHGFYPAITSRYIEWLESRLLALHAQVEQKDSYIFQLSAELSDLKSSHSDLLESFKKAIKAAKSTPGNRADFI